MKKLMAALSAATMLLCTVPAQVSAISCPSLNLLPSGMRAEDIDKRTSSYVAGNGVSLKMIDTRYDRAFAVITEDDTAPSEESLQAISDFESCEKFVVEEELIQGETTWYNNFDSGLPVGTVFYKITVSGYDNLVRSARQYLLENDNVQDIFFMQDVENGGWGTWLDHDTTMTLSIKSQYTLPEEGIENLSIVSYIGEDYSINSYYKHYEVELDDVNKARLNGTDDDLQVLAEVANSVMEQYQDIECSVGIKAIYPAVDNVASPKASSVWLDLGDTDGNTVVNASDAAIVLQEAAEAGAGDTSAAQNLDVMDVNLDGTVNAADAACVLMYAAQAGADGSVDWQDVLR